MRGTIRRIRLGNNAAVVGTDGIRRRNVYIELKNKSVWTQSMTENQFAAAQAQFKTDPNIPLKGWEMRRTKDGILVAPTS